MCNECFQNPCANRCPNANEPKPIYICEQCGDTINAGDKYVDIGGTIICMRCLGEMNREEIIELCGYEACVAEGI